MQYAGFLLRRERLNRNWNQEGLCRGICTVSYLSKIEQGKAAPSEEILRLLMERMGLKWHHADDRMECVIRKAYEILWGLEDCLGKFLAGQEEETFIHSVYGPDWEILSRFACVGNKPLDRELEAILCSRQLALQRILQGEVHEAIRLYPAGLIYYYAGVHAYNDGKMAPALEMLQIAYQLASQEGRVRLMLYSKLYMGNCYCNQGDLHAMEQHYEVAGRLASALHDEQAFAVIGYNRAATQMESGDYEQALGYFQEIREPSCMDLHKLAICYEKLNRPGDAIRALDRAGQAKADLRMPEGMEGELLELVRMRVSDPDYLRNAAYGRKLLKCFERCRKELPSGYAQFHLPWVLEWYENNRQYKLALDVLRIFPERRAEY